MKVGQKLLASLLFGVMLLLISANAAAQIVRDKLPLLTYAETTVPVYDEPDGNKKGRIPPATSLVMVKIIRADGWAYGSYKVGNKKKRVNRWFRMSDLQGYLDFENYIDRAVSDTNAYRTRTSLSLVGRVASDEEIIIVAKRGEKMKIIFLSDGGKYRMGWVDKTIFEKIETQSSDGDGEVMSDGEVMDVENQDGETMTGDDFSGVVEIPNSDSSGTAPSVSNQNANVTSNVTSNATTNANSNADENPNPNAVENSNPNADENAETNENSNANSNSNSHSKSNAVKSNNNSEKSFEGEEVDENISSDEEW